MLSSLRVYTLASQFPAMSVTVSFNFYCQTMRRLKNWGRILFSKLYPCSILMEWFTETIAVIFQDMTSIKSGIILPKSIILKYSTSKKWSSVSKKWDRSYFSVIFMGTLWKKMPLFMAAMTPEILRKASNFLYLWAKSSKDSLSKTVASLIWKKKRVLVELFWPNNLDIVISMHLRVLSMVQSIKTSTSQSGTSKS